MIIHYALFTGHPATSYMDLLPRIAPRVTNVLGAGDTFAGGVIAGLRFTNNPCIALTYGLLASSLVLAEPDHMALLAAMNDAGDGEWGA